MGSFTTVARLAGMTTTRLIRLIDKRKVETKKVLPCVITIDEFTGDTGEKRFQTLAAVVGKEIVEKKKQSLII